RKSAAAVVVERLGAKVIDLHGLAVERDELPGSIFIVAPGCIEGLTDVGPIAIGHKTPEVEVHLLSTYKHPPGTVTNGFGHCHKRLFKIENILIGWREHRLPGCKVALELREHLDLISDMKVGVPVRAADQVIVVAIRADAEVRHVIRLEALPEVSAE